MGEQRTEQGLSAAARFVLACRARPAVTLVLVGGLSAICYLAALALWPSDTYRAKRAVAKLLNAVEDGDVPAILSHVSPYFSEEGVDRRMLGAMLEHVLARNQLARASLTFQQIQVIHGRGVMKIHVRSFHKGEFGGGMAHTEWLLGLEEIDGRWLVREATPLSLNNRRVAGLRAVLAAGY